MRLKGIKRTLTVWKQQCIKCGETGYVIPIWYTRIWHSYLHAVPSKDATEKTGISKQKFGRPSFNATKKAQERCYRNESAKL